MAAKYGDWTRGEDEALLNIIGGVEVARAILRGDTSVHLIGPSLIYATTLIPKGWTIVADVKPSLSEGKTIEMVPFFKEGDDKCVNGAVMQIRAVQLKANLGLADAKYLLEHQSEIPDEFKNNYLVFTGTLLRNPKDNSLNVACLYWDGGSWCKGFTPLLDDNWNDRGRLVRCK